MTGKRKTWHRHKFSAPKPGTVKTYHIPTPQRLAIDLHQYTLPRPPQDFYFVKDLLQIGIKTGSPAHRETSHPPPTHSPFLHRSFYFYKKGFRATPEELLNNKILKTGFIKIRCFCKTCFCFIWRVIQ